MLYPSRAVIAAIPKVSKPRPFCLHHRPPGLADRELKYPAQLKTRRRESRRSARIFECNRFRSISVCDHGCSREAAARCGGVEGCVCFLGGLSGSARRVCQTDRTCFHVMEEAVRCERGRCQNVTDGVDMASNRCRVRLAHRPPHAQDTRPLLAIADHLHVAEPNHGKEDSGTSRKSAMREIRLKRPEAPAQAQFLPAMEDWSTFCPNSMFMERDRAVQAARGIQVGHQACASW